MEKERFMLDDLKIPAEWIHEAKVGLGKLGLLFLVTSVNVHFFTSVPSSKQTFYS